MATAASRRLATTALSAAVLVPSGVLLAAPGFADSATPTAGIGEAIYAEVSPAAESGPLPGQYVPATESSPATPGWITGGTLQESQAKPAVKPVVKPVAKPATVAQPVRVRRPAAVVQGPTVARDTTAPAGEPTVLPFTGPGRLEAQTATGVALVLLGGFVLFAARPRRTA